MPIEAGKWGEAFPGLVRDDTGVVTAARPHRLAVEALDVLMPEPAFPLFDAALGRERQNRPSS